MSWQTPKTYWEVKPYIDGAYQGDWFNYTDYNRIMDNLNYLHTLGQNVLGIFFTLAEMSPAALNAFPRAGDINVLEDNLYAITQNVYAPPSYTGKKTWVGNAAAPTYEDLNRLEQACYDVYVYLRTLVAEQVFAPLGADALLTSTGETIMVVETL